MCRHRRERTGHASQQCEVLEWSTRLTPKRGVQRVDRQFGIIGSRDDDGLVLLEDGRHRSCVAATLGISVAVVVADEINGEHST
jgi:hypothetical protein